MVKEMMYRDCDNYGKQENWKIENGEEEEDREEDNGYTHLRKSPTSGQGKSPTLVLL